MSEEDRSRRMEGLKAKYQDLLKRAQPVADKGARLNDRIEGVLKRRKSGEEDEEEGTRKSGEEDEEEGKE